MSEKNIEFRKCLESSFLGKKETKFSCAICKEKCQQHQSFICQTTFPNAQGLYLHIKVSHFAHLRCFPCISCNTAGKSLRSLQYHALALHGSFEAGFQRKKIDFSLLHDLKRNSQQNISFEETFEEKRIQFEQETLQKYKKEDGIIEAEKGIKEVKEIGIKEAEKVIKEVEVKEKGIKEAEKGIKEVAENTQVGRWFPFYRPPQDLVSPQQNKFDFFPKANKDDCLSIFGRFGVPAERAWDLLQQNQSEPDWFYFIRGKFLFSTRKEFETCFPILCNKNTRNVDGALLVTEEDVLKGEKIGIEDGKEKERKGIEEKKEIGFFKIGITRNLLQRLCDLDRAFHRKLYILELDLQRTVHHKPSHETTMKRRLRVVGFLPPLRNPFCILGPSPACSFCSLVHPASFHFAPKPMTEVGTVHPLRSWNLLEKILDTSTKN